MHAPGDMARILARLRRINSMTLWAARFAEQIASLKGTVDQLEQRITTVESDLLAAWAELAFSRRIMAVQAGLDPELIPPPEYILAVRTPQIEDCRAIEVIIDGAPCLIGLNRDRPTVPDPLREIRDWQQLVATIRTIDEAAS